MAGTALLGKDDFQLVQEEFGAADDPDEDNDKLQAWVDAKGDCNFYTYASLMLIDPSQEFKTYRSYMKMILLPFFQLLVPFGMAWYFLVTHAMIAENGYCCDNTNLVFRFTGFVTFMYSAWQIIDGADDSAARYLVTKAVEMWSRTGRQDFLKQAGMFYVGFVSQQICCMLLLIVTYVIYTTQCDTPLDLLMNCVAINFVLDIDSEWMDDSRQAKSQQSTGYLFKLYRDTLVTNEAETRRVMQSATGMRKNAPYLVETMSNAGDFCVMVAAYVLVFGWTFCPSSM